MPKSDWRSSEDYAPLNGLDGAGLAWEYLRRNPDFERDRRRLEGAARQDQAPSSEVAAFARRWGVRFRANPKERVGPATCPVDAPGASHSRLPHEHPA